MTDPVAKLVSSLAEHIKNNTLNEFLASFAKLTSEHFPTKSWPTLQELSLSRTIPDNTLQAAVYNHYRVYDALARLPDSQLPPNSSADLMTHLKKIVRLLVKKYQVDPNSVRPSKLTRISNNSPFTELYLFQLLTSIAVGFEVFGSGKTDNPWDYDSVIKLCNLCDASVSINTYLADFLSQRGKVFSFPAVAIYMSYISLLVKLRINCSAGKYREALLAVENVDIFRDSILFCPQSVLSFFYYKAFALLMTREVIQARDTLLSALWKVKGSGEDLRDKMHSLLSICFYIWPGSLRSECPPQSRETYWRIKNDRQLAADAFSQASPAGNHCDHFLGLVGEFGRYSMMIDFSRVFASMPGSLLASRFGIVDVAGLVRDYAEVVGRNRVDGWDPVTVSFDGDFVEFARKEKEFDVNRTYEDLFYKIGKVNGRINFSKTLAK